MASKTTAKKPAAKKTPEAQIAALGWELTNEDPYLAQRRNSEGGFTVKHGDTLDQLLADIETWNDEHPDD